MARATAWLTVLSPTLRLGKRTRTVSALRSSGQLRERRDSLHLTSFSASAAAAGADRCLLVA